MCKLHFTICIYIFFYFQPNIQAYKIYQLNPNARNELLPRLKQILEAEKNEAPPFEKVYFNNVKSKNPKFKPIGKSVFVKRILPHGYKGDDYEYDSKLNTVYKPLMRYHVKKPAAQHERTIVKEMEADYNSKNRPNDGLVVLVKRDRGDPQELLRKIQNFLKTNSRQDKQKKDKGWNQKRFRGVLSRQADNEDAQLLRIQQKSGEVHDPFAPGKLPAHMISSEASGSEEKPPKFTLPNYPFYNYWTYQKNVIQDLCPINTVQMGNMCVSVTGHRRTGSLKDALKAGDTIVF